MTRAQAEFIEGFNAALDQRCTYRFITRNSELQRTACAELDEIRTLVSEEKARAVVGQDERFANVLLGCEALVGACIAEIKMYVLLKEDKPDAAWTELVTAQAAFEAALRADPGFAENTARQLQRLQHIERLVFPPQAFLSTGWIVKEEICSICNSDYADCEHVKGRPYMGQFCVVHLRGLEANHVALVDEPASKHCRLTHKQVSGGRENRMSLLVEPGVSGEGREGEAAEPEGQMYRGILAHFPTSTTG